MNELMQHFEPAPQLEDIEKGHLGTILGLELHLKSPNGEELDKKAVFRVFKMLTHDLTNG